LSKEKITVRIAQFPVAVACIAKRLLENDGNKPDYLEIFSNWEMIVGKSFAAICVPYKVINIGKDKVLILKTIKGRGLEIQHETCKILKLVHNFLKKDTFAQIRVIQIEKLN
jgi:hypothetical protein